MTFDQAFTGAVELLERRGQLLNGHLYRFVRFDEDLFNTVRHQLIADGIAEERFGIGLVKRQDVKNVSNQSQQIVRQTFSSNSIGLMTSLSVVQPTSAVPPDNSPQSRSCPPQQMKAGTASVSCSADGTKPFAQWRKQLDESKNVAVDCSSQDDVSTLIEVKQVQLERSRSKPKPSRSTDSQSRRSNTLPKKRPVVTASKHGIRDMITRDSTAAMIGGSIQVVGIMCLLFKACLIFWNSFARS